MAEAAFAQHLLTSVRSELDLLKKFNYIQSKAYDEILRLLPTTTTMTSQLGYAEALYDFTGSNPSADLNFRSGDKIQIVEYVNDNWWKGTLNGKTGLFPSNYVKKIESPSSGPSPALPSRKTERDNYSMPSGQSYPTPSYSPMTPASTYPPPPPPQQQQQLPQYPPPPQQQQPPQYPPPQQYAPPPTQQPYSTPPPPPQYASPAAANQYALPPAANQYVPPASAPVVAAPQASAPAAAPHEESKLAGFGKQLAGNVANAATWGFGATIGGDIAHSIF